MRESFQQSLQSITDALVDMSAIAGDAVTRATQALLDADVALAEKVIADDARLDTAREQLDDDAISVLALQQPVASDLRTVVASLGMSADLERMGDLARHVAKVARRRYPESAVPEELRATFTDMGAIADRIVRKAGSIISSRDVDEALTLQSDDDAMDELHRTLYTAINKGHYSTEQAIDLALLGRYYERFADHAVALAERVIYLVTGSYELTNDDSDVPATR